MTLWIVGPIGIAATRKECAEGRNDWRGRAYLPVMGRNRRSR